MSDVLGASFRDPSGFVFRHEERIHRQVNQSYADDFEVLLSSGLYDGLVQKGWLVSHAEVEGPLSNAAPEIHYKTLLPDCVPFISHPYEWCFSQLKDAALLTLRIARAALAAGMTLKDASAYNVQFAAGRPVFIDTLSFERYREGEPWVAYRQFCQHFLAPLALMAMRDVRLSQLLRVHLDGVPLDLACSLLPARAWLRGGLLMHLRIHAGFQQRHAASGGARRARPLSRQAFDNLLVSLQAVVRKLDWVPEDSEWAAYTEGDSYEADALAHKQRLVEGHLAEVAPRAVWDLGANVGVYSRLAASADADVISFDADPACVEQNYRLVRESREPRILPLLLDLTNPSPAIGWANSERETIASRARPDLVLALALVHHLAISNNVPLREIAAALADLADELVIEFVPKSDAKVETLLATRRDVFSEYTAEGFEAAFVERYDILARDSIEGSERTLYRMRAKVG
ncbi:MAG: SAM-dependent methyltransferase [Myxococcota bacterium]|nr:SAM-dependent methyltransferase [Myxococcota bacterium]